MVGRRESDGHFRVRGRERDRSEQRGQVRDDMAAFCGGRTGMTHALVSPGDGKRDGGFWGRERSGRESGTGPVLTRWGVFCYRSAMPRTARVAPGGMVFHVLNRGVARMQLFEKPADYQAFEGVLREMRDESPMRICAYSLMPNHWHLVVWPEHDGELASFGGSTTITHVRRWQNSTGDTRGWGMSTRVGISRSRWKQRDYFATRGRSIITPAWKWLKAGTDPKGLKSRTGMPIHVSHFRAGVIRGAERPACQPRGASGIVALVELHRVEREAPAFPILSTWPLPRPTDWLQIVNQPQTEAEVAALRCCVNRGRPFGDPNWVTDTAKRLGLESTIRPRGRAKKQS